MGSFAGNRARGWFCVCGASLIVICGTWKMYFGVSKNEVYEIGFEA
jgi:hypothetical protein